MLQVGFPRLDTAWPVIFEHDYEAICTRYGTATVTYCGVRNDYYYWLAKSSGAHGKKNNRPLPAYAQAAVKAVWKGDRADTVPLEYRNAIDAAPQPTQEEVEMLVDILTSGV